MSAPNSTRLRGQEGTEHRITARTHRDVDGTTRTIYSVDGRPVGSLEAVRAELEGEQ